MSGGSLIWRGLGAFLLCLAVTPASGQAPPPRGPGSLMGVWTTGAGMPPAPGAVINNLGSLRIPERTRLVKTITGEEPPLLPGAAEVLNDRIRRSQAGEPDTLTLTRCLPAVPAMLFGGPYPIQILETPGQVTMLFEEQNHFRIIYLDAKLPEDPDPTYMGHSVGRWEGDTLVVDTIGLVEDTPLDRVGMPHSDALRLTERYRRLDANTLEVLFTVDDPKTFVRSWQQRTVYRPVPAGVKLTEYICANNRDD